MTCKIPIWFDIDGTLLHTRAGHAAFQSALRDIYGWNDGMESVVFAGNTDLQVLMDLSEIHAGQAEAGLSRRHRFFESMAEYLDQGLSDQKPEPVPGAADLIQALVKKPEVLLGLITGNAKDCAYMKLRHLDLDVHFRTGGFGDQHADRNQLAVMAREQLESESMELAPGWVIGDTPRDVKAALHIGARCLGVASGSFTGAELLQAGASEVVTDLFPTQELIGLLLN